SLASSSRTLRTCSASRDTTTMSCPLRANSCARASPMPEVAPVMRATFFIGRCYVVERAVGLHVRVLLQVLSGHLVDLRIQKFSHGALFEQDFAGHGGDLGFAAMLGRRLQRAVARDLQMFDGVIADAD